MPELQVVVGPVRLLRRLRSLVWSEEMRSLSFSLRLPVWDLESVFSLERPEVAAG